MVQLLADVPGDENVLVIVDGKPRGSRPQPLGYDVLVALGTHGLWVLDTESPILLQLDNRGDTVRSVELQVRTPSPSKADIADALELGIGGVRAGSSAGAYSGLDFTRPLPVASTMFLDDAERVWIGLAFHSGARARVWEVYARNSSLSSRKVLRLPSTWRLLSVYEDRILVHVTEDTGIEEVRVYKISES